MLWTHLSIQAQASPAASVKIESVWDFVVKGGPLMAPIVLCSLIALGIIIERLVSLRRSNVIPAGFMEGLRAILARGPHLRQSLEYCRTNDAPLARVVAAAIKHHDESVELMEKHVEDAGAREVFHLRKYLRALGAIGSVATLMGLLGTILGLIEAFGTVAASGEALGKTELLAKGIYEAMITTAAGLFIAIPVLLFHHYFSARVERLISEIDRMTLEFVEDVLGSIRGSTNSERMELIADEAAA